MEPIIPELTCADKLLDRVQNRNFARINEVAHDNWGFVPLILAGAGTRAALKVAVRAGFCSLRIGASRWLAAVAVPS